MKKYGYGDFIRIMNVADPKDYFGFAVKPDGVWLHAPDKEEHRYRIEPSYGYDVTLEPDGKHPPFDANMLQELPPDSNPFETHNYLKKPLLSFPCHQEEFRAFLAQSNLDCMLSPKDELLKDGSVKAIEDEIKDWISVMEEKGFSEKEMVRDIHLKHPDFTAAKISRLLPDQKGQMVLSKSRERSVQRHIKESKSPE